MAFEPLQTDEKLDRPIPKARDMDGQMLFGCSGFVLASVGSYLLSIWPFFAFSNTDRLASLGLASALGFVPAFALGGVATRKFGLAGGCGAIAGALTSAIFLYLRIQQTFLSAAARQAPTPDYPAVLQWLVPTGWVLAVVLAASLLLPRGELLEEGD